MEIERALNMKRNWRQEKEKIKSKKKFRRINSTYPEKAPPNKQEGLSHLFNEEGISKQTNTLLDTNSPMGRYTCITGKTSRRKNADRNQRTTAI